MSRFLNLVAALGVFTIFCEASEREFLIPIEYKYGSSGQWRRRGSILVFSSRVDGTLIGKAISALELPELTGLEYNSQSESHTLVDEDSRDIKSASDNQELYYIRCPTELGKTSPTMNAATSVFSSNEARRLVAAHLTEVIELSLDVSQRRVLSITSLPDVTQAVHDEIESSTQNLGDSYDAQWRRELGHDAFWNVTVRVANTIEAAGPDTVSYLQKLEMERQARQQGDTADNRSFLAKYWMYIVPVVVIMMVTSAATPEQEGQAQ